MASHVYLIQTCKNVQDAVINRSESYDGALLTFVFVIYLFLLTICKYLSALTFTLRIVANEPLLNVCIFFLFCINSVVHTEPWILCTVTPLVQTLTPLSGC